MIDADKFGKFMFESTQSHGNNAFVFPPSEELIYYYVAFVNGPHFGDVLTRKKQNTNRRVLISPF